MSLANPLNEVSLLLLVLLWLSPCRSESNETIAVDCKNGTGSCGNLTTFTPPPAEAMSRLLPSAALLTNESKDASASSLDIITTPESSLGLSAFSKFAQTADHQTFNPSPFLGVISDVKSYPRGVAVGEVFPDTVGDRQHNSKYNLYHRGYHTAHSYHDTANHRPNPLVQLLENNESKPTIETAHHKSTVGPLFKPDLNSFRPTIESYYKTTKSTTDYAFEYPDKHLDDHKYKDGINSITEYKSPFEGYHIEKPIKEENTDDRPFGHDDRPKFPTFIHGMTPPGHHKQLDNKGGNKWKTVIKFLTTLLPFGLLVAALSPSILVVNATEAPVPTKSSFRSLDGFKLPMAPPGVDISDCQMREICKGISSAEQSYQPYIEMLIKRSGGVLKEIVEVSAAGKCDKIPCKT